MSATGSLPRRAGPAPRTRTGAVRLLRDHRLEFGWAAFLIACHAAMVIWPAWHTIPFYLAWISLAAVYGLRVWDTHVTLGVLALVSASTATALSFDVLAQHMDWRMLVKVPLMAMLFMAVVWQARERAAA